MGLLYVFPVSLEEKDFAEVKDSTVTLKTYGLPYIFWGYATAILLIIGFMFFAIKEPVLKLIQLGDDTDHMLGYSLLTFLGLLPVFLMGFFFYEKRLIRVNDCIKMEHRVFMIKVFSETFEMNKENPFSIQAYLDSPNVARMRGGDESAGFQNKGYFVLWLNTKNKKRIQLDRHSRKVDLQKLQDLLNIDN